MELGNAEEGIQAGAKLAPGYGVVMTVHHLFSSACLGRDMPLNYASVVMGLSL